MPKRISRELRQELIRTSTRSDISHADLSLNEKGQCQHCGTKPKLFRGYHLCFRCNRAYASDTRQQIENFSWRKREDGQWMRKP